jgi:hypothetical protein
VYRSTSDRTDEELQRMGRVTLRGNTRLVSVDVATLEQTAIDAQPGIKSFPAVLNDGEIAYVRRDSDGRGISYNSTGKRGPRGMVRSPSWSPDSFARQLRDFHDLAGWKPSEAIDRCR